MEELIKALRGLGIPMSVQLAVDVAPVRVTPESFDLLWDGKKQLHVSMERTTYIAEAEDEPGADNQLTMERLTVERYVG